MQEEARIQEDVQPTTEEEEEVNLVINLQENSAIVAARQIPTISHGTATYLRMSNVITVEKRDIPRRHVEVLDSPFEEAPLPEAGEAAAAATTTAAAVTTTITPTITTARPQEVMEPAQDVVRAKRRRKEIYAAVGGNSTDIRITLQHEDGEMCALLDTGSGGNLVKESAVVDRIKHQSQRVIYGIAGQPIDNLGEVYIQVAIADQHFLLKAVAVPDNTAFDADILIGMRSMTALDLIVKMKDRKVICKKTRPHVIIDFLPPTGENHSSLATGTESSNIDACPDSKLGSSKWQPVVQTAHLGEDLRMGALEQRVCVAHVKGPDGCYLVPKGLVGHGRVMVAETLGRVVNGRYPVLLLNPYDSEIMLPKNTMLGELEQIDENKAEFVRTSFEYAQFMRIDEQKNSNDSEVSMPLSENPITLEHLDCPPKLKSRLLKFLQSRRDVLSLPGEPLGRTHLIKQDIKLEPGTVPIYTRQYPTPVGQAPALDQAVDEMLEANVIRPTYSPWNSPIILVRKSDGSFRPCVDFRKLNSVTISDKFPLPRITELLQSLAGSKVFTNLDLQSAYWQVEIEEEDRAKTAFTTSRGHYEYMVMPFGLKNAPSVFSRLMAITLHGLIGLSALVYLDDIVIYSKDEDEHFEKLGQVLERLREAKLKVKLPKCKFFQEKIRFLGHNISAEGISMHESHFDPIKKYPTPKNRKGVQKFLGLASYFRMFIPEFGKIANPITDLLKKDVPYVWGPEQEKAFKELKQALLNPPVLAYPVFDKPFFIATDASDTALGAVLMQEEAGKFHPIFYASRSLTPTERRYSVTKREALGVVYALRNFRYLVLGHKTILFTDHQPLRFLFRTSIPEGQLGRWAVLAQEYDMKIVYLSGKLNVVADSLSRIQGITIPEDRLPKDDDETAIEHVALAQSEEETPLTWSQEELRREQTGDARIKTIKNAIVGKTQPDPESIEILKSLNIEEYIVCEDILYKRIETTRLGAPYSAVLVVLPDSLLERAIKLTHDPPVHGHQGWERTVKKLQERFDYPLDKLKRVTKEIVQNCDPCIRVKARAPVPVPAGKYPLPSRPWERVAMDFLGPLPTTPRGQKYILVVTDALTRYSVIRATSDRTADTVVRTLREIFSQFGIPATLISDNAAEFCGEAMNRLCTSLGTNKIQITPFHPASNGLVERVNGKINRLLKFYASYMLKSGWDEFLPEVALAINSSFNETVGDNPFYALFRSDPRVPSGEPEGPTTRVSYTQYFDFHVEESLRAHLIYSYVRDVLDREVDKYLLHINKKRIPRDLNEGARVYFRRVRKPEEHQKFSSKWIGPCRIIRRTRNNSFELLNPETRRNQVVHIDNILSLKHNVNKTVQSLTNENSKKKRRRRRGRPTTEDENLNRRVTRSMTKNTEK